MIETQENVLDDERVQEILQGLAKGVTREELAEQFKHASYKTLDVYMRRRGFEWDSDKKNYRFPVVKTKTAIVDTSKAHRIIQLIEQQEQVDLKRIAHLMGFENYMELAAYMASQNYVWSNAKNNYEKQMNVKVESEEVPSMLPESKEELEDEDIGELNQYIPLLKMLKANELKLLQLLQPYSNGGQIPRYTIPGVAKTKTVQMIHSLDQMVTDFAKEKNMTQRDVFEVALIDFFKRYGYEHQVESLLK